MNEQRVHLQSLYALNNHLVTFIIINFNLKMNYLTNLTGLVCLTKSTKLTSS